MKIKSMKEVKAILAMLVTLAVLLTCKQANSLPPTPSNWIVNPANPLYFPRRTTPHNNGAYTPNSSSSVESLTLEQRECLAKATSKLNSINAGMVNTLNGHPTSENFQGSMENSGASFNKIAEEIAECTK
jgi:hypothetical protein